MKMMERRMPCQNVLLKTCNKRLILIFPSLRKDISVRCYAGRMSEEVGELAREVNHTYGEKPKKSTEADNSIELELGDILFITICFANSLGIDLTEAMIKSCTNSTRGTQDDGLKLTPKLISFINYTIPTKRENRLWRGGWADEWRKSNTESIRIHTWA